MAAHDCRCGKNAFHEGTCMFCGTGDATAAPTVLRPRHPAIPTITRTCDRRDWTHAMVAAAIRRWYRETGRTPRGTEWQAAGAWWPSTSTVIRLYGTWKAAIFSAGFTPPNQGRPAQARRRIDDGARATVTSSPRAGKPAYICQERAW